MSRPQLARNGSWSYRRRVPTGSRSPTALGCAPPAVVAVTASRPEPTSPVCPPSQFSSPLHAFAAAHVVAGRMSRPRDSHHPRAIWDGTFAATTATPVDVLAEELYRVARPEAERLGVRPAPPPHSSPIPHPPPLLPVRCLWPPSPPPQSPATEATSWRVWRTRRPCSGRGQPTPTMAALSPVSPAGRATAPCAGRRRSPLPTWPHSPAATPSACPAGSATLSTSPPPRPRPPSPRGCPAPTPTAPGTATT